MQRTEEEDNEYSMKMKNFLLNTLSQSEFNDQQMLQELVRQILTKKSQQQYGQEQPKKKEPALLTKRKIQHQMQQQKKNVIAQDKKQRTLTEYKFKPKEPEKAHEEALRDEMNKHRLANFQACLCILKRPKRSSRSKSQSSSVEQFKKSPDKDELQSSLMFLNIHDSYYYMEGVKRPQKAKVSGTRPCEKFEQIQYQMPSQDEYEDMKCELQGQQVPDDNPEQEKESEQDSMADDFCVSDGHLSADEVSSTEDNRLETFVANVELNNEWLFRYGQKEPERCKINIIGNVQEPLILSRKLEFINKNEGKISQIHQASHGQTRANIIQSLKTQFGIQKDDAVGFINNFCSKRVVDKKTIYYVKQIEEEESKMASQSKVQQKMKIQIQQSRRSSKNPSK